MTLLELRWVMRMLGASAAYWQQWALEGPEVKQPYDG